MHAGKRWMQSRLRGRADSEHAQVFVRIAITTLFAAYLGWEVRAGGSAAGPRDGTATLLTQPANPGSVPGR